MKSILITGCSDGGIGSSLAETFQEHDLHVFATARTISKMSNISHLANVTLLTLDVTSASSIEAAVETVKAATGGTLDYIFHNSGVSFVMPTVDTNIEEAKKMFDVNFWGVIATTQAFIPLVLAARGTIVITSSINELLLVPWMGLYGASKSALGKVSETLRLEMAPFGVNVITIVTGAVESNLMANGLDFKLPPGSIYAPIAKNIDDLSRGEDEASPKSRMKSKDYADRVVSDVLRGSTGRIYRGGLASIVRYITSYAPAFMIVSPYL